MELLVHNTDDINAIERVTVITDKGDFVSKKAMVLMLDDEELEIHLLNLQAKDLEKLKKIIGNL